MSDPQCDFRCFLTQGKAVSIATIVPPFTFHEGKIASRPQSRMPVKSCLGEILNRPDLMVLRGRMLFKSSSPG